MLQLTTCSCGRLYVGFLAGAVGTGDNLPYDQTALTHNADLKGLAATKAD